MAEPRLGPLYDAPGGWRPRGSASAFPSRRATAPSTSGKEGASRSGFLRCSQPREVPMPPRKAGPLASGLQVETRRLESGVPSPLPSQPQAGEAPALRLSLYHISKPLSLGRTRVHFTPNTCRVPGPSESWTNLPSPLVDAQSFSNGEETPPAGGYRVQALPSALGDPPPNGPVRGEEKAGRGHPKG